MSWERMSFFPAESSSMNCIQCVNKNCRKASPCGAHSLEVATIVSQYHEPEVQKIVQAAARLVDGGRAGQLSRLEEVLEFIQQLQYKKVGLAYCYGMENEAALVQAFFKRKGILLSAVACTVGGIAQKDCNEQSSLAGVACNPLGQAEQLNKEKADFVMTMGLCLGHDVLFHKQIKADTTTLVVKDRVYNNNPLRGIKVKKSDKE